MPGECPAHHRDKSRPPGPDQFRAFREDLYFRLNVIRFAIPPLRERVEDVPLLVDHYVNTFSQTHKVPLTEITGEAMDALKAYRWPGNIRELKNVVETDRSENSRPPGSRG
jgi:DNA-binding NtrC family response regulator